MTTGEKLQKLRKESNYTQEDLAEILKVSRQSISKWESDIVFPETEKLITLAKLYHCSVDYLLNPDNNEKTINVVTIKEERQKKNYDTKLMVSYVAILLSVMAAIAFIVLFSLFIKNVVIYNKYWANAKLDGVEGIGGYFNYKDLVNSTIKFAGSQGVTITKDSDTFIQWQNALLGKYTLRGTTYFFNGLGVPPELKWRYLAASLSLLVVGLALFIPSFIYLKRYRKTLNSQK